MYKSVEDDIINFEVKERLLLPKKNHLINMQNKKHLNESENLSLFNETEYFLVQ